MSDAAFGTSEGSAVAAIGSVVEDVVATITVENQEGAIGKVEGPGGFVVLRPLVFLKKDDCCACTPTKPTSAMDGKILKYTTTHLKSAKRPCKWVQIF
jgi:hypothetical protein